MRLVHKVKHTVNFIPFAQEVYHELVFWIYFFYLIHHFGESTAQFVM